MVSGGFPGVNSAEFRSRVHNCAHPSIPKPFPVSEFREFRKSAIPGFPFPAPRFPHPNSPIPVPGIPTHSPDSESPIPESPPFPRHHPPTRDQPICVPQQSTPEGPGSRQATEKSMRKPNKHKLILRVSKENNENNRTNYIKNRL